MGGRGVESRLNGRQAEEIVAGYQNEPIGDSGQPWEGDSIDRRYSTDIVEQDNVQPQVSNNIRSLQNEFDRLDKKDHFTAGDQARWNRLVAQIDELYRRNPSRQIYELWKDVHGII